jgi:hypothetical protein
MKGNESGHPKSVWWAWTFALLALDGAAGLWLWQTDGAYVPLWLVVGLLGLTAAFGVVWLYRVRTTRRFLAVLDAYAERELAPAERRLKTPSVKRSRGLSRSSV